MGAGVFGGCEGKRTLSLRGGEVGGLEFIGRSGGAEGDGGAEGQCDAEGDGGVGDGGVERGCGVLFGSTWNACGGSERGASFCQWR